MLVAFDPKRWPVVKELLMRENLAFYASEILRGPPEPPYKGRFVVGRHHERWADLVNSHKRLCVIAPRDHGKCKPAGSLVTLADGRRVPIETLANSHTQVVAFDVEALEFKPAHAEIDAPTDPRPCLRITTRTGRTAIVTREHPLLSWGGWAPCETLEVGTRIAVPRRLLGLGAETQDLDPDRAWLLGLLAGDGCLTQGAPHIAKCDVSVQHAVGVAVARWGWTFAVTRDGSRVELSADYSRDKDSPRNWLRAHSLSEKGAHEKRVPPQIFAGSDTSIAEFLSGLVDSDCHISLHAGGSVELYTVSEQFARDLQHLLVRLGVVAVLACRRGRYKSAEHLSWRLAVRGEDVLILAGWVNPRSETRREALRLLVELQEEKGVATGHCVDSFPKEAWELVEHSEDWFRSRGLPRPTRASNPTRSKLQRIALAEGNTRLAKVSDAPVLWDEIIEIRDVGSLSVYPIHVERYENYVADDFIDHNSHVFTYAYPLWMAEKHPGRSGYIFSASQPQAEEILMKLMREVEMNPKLAHLLPRKLDDKNKARMKTSARWSAKTIEFANGFVLHARGYGTKVRGGHPIFLICDDILNDETAFSETIRRKEIDYFYNALSNMVVPGGQIIAVGTPFHARDLYGDLKSNKNYVVAEFPAITPDGKALWPERYDLKALDAKRDEIKSLRFAREFLCQPVTDVASLFPLQLFKGDQVEQPTVRLGMDWRFWESKGVRHRYMGVDFAISTETGADYTVIFTIGIDPLGNHWIIDIMRDRGLAFGEQKLRIVEHARRYKPGLIFVEDNQMQRIFGDELIRETDLPIKNFTTTAQKHSLDLGLPGLRTLFENRKIRIPRGDEYSVKRTDEWIDEMRSFTITNGRVISVAEHDDMPMAFWICEQAAKGGNFSFAFEEDLGDKAAYDEWIKETMSQDPEDEWDDHVPGSVPRRGRPSPYINAVDPTTVDESEDNPRNPHGMPKTGNTRPSRQDTDWKPQDGAPRASDFMGGVWTRGF